MPANPQSEQELLSPSLRHGWLPLAQLAATAGIPVPRDLRRDKGLDRAVDRVAAGASAGSRPEQDFPDLGIELKTIPVDPQGQTAGNHLRLRGPSSGSPSAGRNRTCNKLSRVLWIPGGRQPRHPHRRPSRRHAAAMESE